MKYCYKCKASKEKSHYHKDSSRPDGLNVMCKSCVQGKVRARNLKAFGLLVDEYDRMLAAQNYVCAVCGKPEYRTGNGGATKRLAVHHNHTTGQIVALCCQDCNIGMGLLKDDPALLRRAAELNERGNHMVFANVPQDKYENLSPEDKKAVDDFRNQEYDVNVQDREGNYSDVISREDNASVDAPVKPRKASFARNVNDGK